MRDEATDRMRGICATRLSDDVFLIHLCFGRHMTGWSRSTGESEAYRGKVLGGWVGGTRLAGRMRSKFCFASQL